MSKKILGVCGDSFMSAINDIGPDSGYGKHFTEIIGKKLDWDVVTFARGGCSNQTIRLQIDEIIKFKPDFVIIGLTTPDRIEIPIDDLSTLNYYDKFHQTNYLIQDGLYNIQYDSYPDQSSNHNRFKLIKPKLKSETINNILSEVNANKYFTKEQIDALKQYYNYLYDFQWKTQQDNWIISDGLHKLIYNKIEFVVINSHLNDDIFYYCNDKVIGKTHELNPWTYYNHNITTPFRFHLPEDIEIILAEKWYEYLLNLLKDKKII